jgi:ribose 5-phosphate isomerase A
MSTDDAIERERREAGEAAALMVESGMRLGLGTGRTVAYFLTALAERGVTGLRCVATSPETEEIAGRLGIPVEPFGDLDRLDIAVDGADQITPDRWLVKGGHGAHVREKIVAASADRFVVIADSSKLVDRLGPPVPLELLRFGLAATLRDLAAATLREGAPPSADGGVIADFGGEIEDPAAVAARLDAHPGVVGHGMFEPALVHRVLVGGADDARPNG